MHGITGRVTNSLPNCDYCGRWVGYHKPYVTWTYYGDAFDMEPPDPVFAHKTCWDQHPDDHALTNSVSWAKPQVIGE